MMCPALIALAVLLCAISARATEADIELGAVSGGKARVNVASPDGRVVMYWANAGVFAGQTVTAVRNGNIVAQILVTEVTSFYVQGKVISGAVQDGDMVQEPQQGMTGLSSGASAMIRKKEPAAMAPDPEPPPKKLIKEPEEERVIVLRPQPEPEPEPLPEPEEEVGRDHINDNAGAGPLSKFGKNVEYGVGGGLFKPTGDFMNGNSGVVSLGGFTHVGRYEGSMLYSVITPGFERPITYQGTQYERTVRLSKVHLALAQRKRSRLLPAISMGLGYTFSFFTYDVCATTCSSTSGQAHGPHVLARARLRYPFRVIAEARYQWDVDTDLEGLDTDGFEMTFLFPFDI